MRRLLVENARRKQRQRHGGQHQRVELADDDLACAVPDEVLLELDEALSQLAKEDPVKAKLVELRYFVGLTEDEAAAVLKISRATAKRHWRYARAWLHRQVADDEATDPIPENL